MTHTNLNQRWVIFSLATCMSLSSLGTSIANVALPKLSQTFFATYSEIQWVVVSYLLASTISIVAVGRLGDIFGRQKILWIGLLLFTFSAFACGISNSLSMLLFARVLQGIGSAILMALSVALVGELIPKNKIGRTMGLLGTASAVGTASGPALGGFMLSAFGWEFIFYLVCLLGLLGSIVSFYAFPKPSKDYVFNSKQFDSTGAGLLGFTLIFYALAVSNSIDLLADYRPLLFVSFFFFGTCFYLYEKSVESPLMPFKTIKEMTLTSNFLMNICVSTIMMCTLIVGPFYLSKILGLESMTVGAVMTVGPVVSIISGFPAGRAVDILGPSKVMFFGLSFLLVGSISFSVLPSKFGIVGYIISASLLSPGYQMFQAGNNSKVMMGIEDNQKGVISGLLSLSRNVGLITGASAMGMIFSIYGMEKTFLVAAVFASLALLLGVKINLMTGGKV